MSSLRISGRVLGLWRYEKILGKFLSSGDNSTCIGGCDNKIWSEAVVDSCGVCGGNGDSCQGNDIVTGNGGNGGKSISGGAVAGIVIGLLAFFAIVAAVAYLYIRRRNRKSSTSNDVAMTITSVEEIVTVSPNSE
jgi:hypothetical protein